MPPIVAKVVDVDQRVAFGQKQFGNRHFTFVNDLDITVKSIIIRHAPILAVLLKLVQVAVSPTENRLKSVMEAAQGYRARDLDSPPDGRFDAGEGDLELVDGRPGFCCGKKAYCPPGTAPWREPLMGTPWNGLYWRQDGSRAHGASRVEIGGHRDQGSPRRGKRQRDGDRLPSRAERYNAVQRSSCMPDGPAVLSAVESLPFGVMTGRFAIAKTGGRKALEWSA